MYRLVPENPVLQPTPTIPMGHPDYPFIARWSQSLDRGDCDGLP